MYIFWWTKNLKNFQCLESSNHHASNTRMQRKISLLERSLHGAIKMDVPNTGMKGQFSLNLIFLKFSTHYPWTDKSYPAYCKSYRTTVLCISRKNWNETPKMMWTLKISIFRFRNWCKIYPVQLCINIQNSGYHDYSRFYISIEIF